LADTLSSFFVFTWFGFASASLWVFSSILSIFAINNAGLAVSQGLWSGATIIVSFLWGSLYFKQTPDSLPLAICALVLVSLGIAGISIAGTELLAEKKMDIETQRLLRDDVEESTVIDDEVLPRRRLWLGILCALGLSITNGSMLVPLKFAPPEVGGINFIVSFAIGVFVVTPVFALIYFGIRRTMPEMKVTRLALPGIMAGIGWNIGNWASIYATIFLGFTIGFPLSQCALLVAGMWGILLFREITGTKRVVSLFVGSGILIVGAVLLGLFGGKP